MLQLRREQVVELRRINGIPNSWMRLRPALVVEMQKLLEQEPGLSDRSLTLRLNAMGYNVSLSGKGTAQQFARKKAEPQPEPAVEITTQEETEDTNVFAGMIGYDGGLKAQIHQAKGGGILSAQRPAHTHYWSVWFRVKRFWQRICTTMRCSRGLLAPDAPFVSFNCADYADNPQLLNSQLFGYVRGAFSGANATRTGLVQKADGGILF